MAKNRYGWQKRAKEMARKEKNDEKMKRRQGKAINPPEEELSEVLMDNNQDDTDPVGEDLQQGS